MATATDSKVDTAIADAAAEKAYAAAAEKVEAPKPAVTAPVAAKVEAPAPVVAAPAAKPVVAPAVAKAAPAKKAPVVKAKKPAAAKKVAAKPAAKPAAVKKAPKVVKAPVKITKTVKTAAKAQPKKSVAAKAPTLSKLKDTIMAKTQTTTEDFTAKLSTVVADVQERAKVAYEKSTAVAGEYTEFSKGNVQALVEAGKILAAGVQDLGTAYVAEAKSAFETVTADVKELAAVKSPTDFFKLQGEILRRNFDAAVAAGSKNSEAVIKLANDAFAPLSSRVSLAVEKVKKAA